MRANYNNNSRPTSKSLEAQAFNRAHSLLKKKKTFSEILNFTQEHAHFLAEFYGYNKKAVKKVMNVYLSAAQIMSAYDTYEALEDFKVLSAKTITELELNCR